AAGKHIHIEKPTAPTVNEAMELARLADRAGLKHGVIQDKLFLPGFAKLLSVRKSGFFGRILSLKIDAGSWIFDGTEQECQRPSRDDTMVVQIDGTEGSAVAGRFRCFTQSAADTPEAFTAAAKPGGVDLMAHWHEVPDTQGHKNPFRQCWEAFLRHVGEDTPYLPTLVEGAK